MGGDPISFLLSQLLHGSLSFQGSVLGLPFSRAMPKLQRLEATQPVHFAALFCFCLFGGQT